MAGARNSEAGDIDTTIGTLLTQFATYKAVSVTGEADHTASNYFLRSLFNRLETNSDLSNYMSHIVPYNHPAFKPVSKAEAASPTLVLIDPQSVA